MRFIYLFLILYSVSSYFRNVDHLSANTYNAVQIPLHKLEIPLPLICDHSFLPPRKRILREDSVFSRVCVSVNREGLCLHVIGHMGRTLLLPVPH